MKLLYPILTIPGVVALFLSFTYSTSPWDVIREEVFTRDSSSRLQLFYVSFPFFLSIPICLWSIRILFNNQLSKAEIVTAYLLATFALISNLFITIPAIDELEEIYDILTLFITWISVLFSILIVANNMRRLVPQVINVPISLHLAYLPNAIFCLLVFSDDGGLEKGAYLVIFTSIVYIAKIVSLAKVKWEVGKDEH